MAKEEVIELSVDETNELRKKLGLAPLRVGNTAATPTSTAAAAIESGTNSNEEVLEMSVDEANDLRAKLGLAPLKTGPAAADGSSARAAVHQPAPNTGEERELQERLEKARLEREVQQGIQKLAAAGDEDDVPQDAQSWAARMRAKKSQAPEEKKPAKKGKSKKKKSAKYDEKDLEGLAVSHNVSELEAGSTTVLTLQDAPLLKTQTDTSGKVTTLDEDGEVALENVDLASQQRQKDRLHQKRQVEMGMGRAGGYAGFDDDEFEELGGTQGPLRVARGTALGGPPEEGNQKRRPGFQIGQAIEEEEATGNDLFAAHEGRAISLEPAKADVTASDFMTVEEYEAEVGPSKKKKKKKEKDSKFKKKKKKEKKHRRKQDIEDEEDEVEAKAPSAKGLLEELEETAVEVKPKGRKRRRSDSDEGGDTRMKEVSEAEPAKTEQDEVAMKRAKFDEIMAKGNARTAAAFGSEDSKVPIEDEEPDDAFLNAALAKARRLRRLKEMSEPQVRGADAVTQALQDSHPTNGDKEMKDASAEGGDGGLTFAADDTREFTRALRARAEQAERQQRKPAPKGIELKVDAAASKPTPMAVETVDEEMDEDTGDMAELAKEVTEDGDQGGAPDFDGTTANQVTVGRGMSNVLSMLRQTGEITGKNAGREELRGRAKDKRTYEDYEALDLKNVVKIDDRNATDKDKELANREIKLEYRDEHGRLLTRKEAYRNLCYQFHGHGSSKKNEERRLRQIEREQAAARLASRQVADDSGKAAGSLGALKATQRATGKAFIVHKT